MPHWKSMTDRDYLYAFDLNGKDVTVSISRCVAGELVSTGGKKSRKPMLYVLGSNGAESPKPLALNATNAKSIAAMYGNDVDGWKGKRITLYPTTTTMGGDTVECIRVRPTVPKPIGKDGAE